MKKFWSREESKERFPLPISPLGWSLLHAPTQSTLDSLSDSLHLKRITPHEMIKNIHHYVYARRGFFKAGVLKRLRFFHIVALSLNIFFFFIRSGGRKFKFLSLFMADTFVPRAESVIREWDNLKISLLSRMRDASAGDVSQKISHAEFVATKFSMEKNSCEYFYHDFAVFFLKNALFEWLIYSLKYFGKSADEASSLMTAASQGLSENFAIKMALEQSSLSSTEWLSRYGHLTDNWDVFAPTLSETENTSRLKSLVHLPGLHQEKERQRLQAEKLISDIFHSNELLIRCLMLFQRLLMIDEDMRAYSSLQYPEIRKLFRRVALTAGWSFEDIFFITVDEVELGLKNNDFSPYVVTAQMRRQEYNKALQINPPDDYVESNGEITALENSRRPSFSGRSVSSGSARARALIVKSLEDLKNFSGQEILFLRSATPTYAAYYSQCAGIVSETGGLLSHGALVAREFQIPMISDVSGALELIKTGDMIYLDATQGRFEVL